MSVRARVTVGLGCVCVCFRIIHNLIHSCPHAFVLLSTPNTVVSSVVHREHFPCEGDLKDESSERSRSHPVLRVCRGRQ